MATSAGSVHLENKRGLEMTITNCSVVVGEKECTEHLTGRTPHHTCPTIEDKVLPLLKGEPNQHILTTSQPAGCDRKLALLALQDTLPRSTFHRGIGNLP
ncbi:hypothetical protein E2C01_019444 [Portunus trituberculatus]|uniref:Uncharacterized protein n=1 Tax=Portunus trituberculatus TaxID=210409 RepID=A0A5B7DXX1_PORTR|nr:hypothetical protein [Portunus trituberculatus]